MNLDELLEQQPKEIQDAINEITDKAGTFDADWQIFLTAAKIIVQSQEEIKKLREICGESYYLSRQREKIT